ncbi:MAG: hypothetical protein KME54_20475 [Tolypothrix brevis GSE-NOS-MK-07-07A]|nr:hypothetical protein [Tolypothrix brevis GSE-NOS-MK-07-07A]
MFVKALSKLPKTHGSGISRCRDVPMVSDVETFRRNVSTGVKNVRS